MPFSLNVTSGDYLNVLNFGTLQQTFNRSDWCAPIIPGVEHSEDTPIFLLVYRYPFICRGSSLVNTIYTYDNVNFSSDLAGYRYKFITYFGINNLVFPDNNFLGGWTDNQLANMIGHSWISYNISRDQLEYLGCNVSYSGGVITNRQSTLANSSNKNCMLSKHVTYSINNSVFSEFRPTDDQLGLNPNTTRLFKDLPDYESVALTGANTTKRFIPHTSIPSGLTDGIKISDYCYKYNELYADYDTLGAVKLYKRMIPWSFGGDTPTLPEKLLICRPFFLIITSHTGIGWNDYNTSNDVLNKAKNATKASIYQFTFVGVEKI